MILTTGLSLTGVALCAYALRRNHLDGLEDQKWKEYDQNVETKENAKEWLEAYAEWKKKWPKKDEVK